MNRCPKCRALTTEEDHYCRRCGTRLDQPVRRGRLPLVWLAIGGAIVVLALFFWATPEERRSSTAPTPADTNTDTPDRVAALPAGDRSEARSASPPVPLAFPSVWVRISDAAGREIAALPAPVVGAGWVALPRQEVLGGALWEAELPDGQRVSISAGVQADEDTVGLWQLDAIGDLTPPPLAAWESQKPLFWRPLISDDLFPVTLEECTHQVQLEQCPDSAAPAAAGMLLQEGRVVGWTFDKSPPGRFLWTSATGDNLQPTLRVADFYRLSFAGGREEQLLLAMENEDLTTTERLAALTTAFGLEPRLSPGEQHELFDEAPAKARLHQLVDILLANGQSAVVADSFESRLLAQLSDPDLCAKVASAAMDAYGGSYALNLVDEVLYWSPEGSDTGAIEALYHKLALQTLKALAADKAVEQLQEQVDALSARFSDDAAIYLYRVEAALLAGDLSLARELLAAGRYPVDLLERATALAARIDEAFSLSGAIVIPFTPGSGTIQTQARLNGQLSQRFLVDTGATFTTIPSATADRLGLAPGSARRRQVSTAGGTVSAWETRLESIVLEDQAVTDLTVLVLDIPDYPDLGLLGMNFIHYFEMGLDNQKGLLMLRPR